MGLKSIPTQFIIDKIGFHYEARFPDIYIEQMKDKVKKEFDDIGLDFSNECNKQVFQRLGSSGLAEYSIDNGLNFACKDCLDMMEKRINALETRVCLLNDKITKFDKIFSPSIRKLYYERIKKLDENRSHFEQLSNNDVKINLLPDFLNLYILDDDQIFYSVDMKHDKFHVEKLTPLIGDFDPYIEDNDRADGYLVYFLYNEDGVKKDFFTLKNFDFIKKGFLPTKRNHHYIFTNKNDLLIFLEEEKMRNLHKFDNAIHKSKMLS